MILIEAPSSACHGGMLVVRKGPQKRRRPPALLPHTASILRRHRLAGPTHIPHTPSPSNLPDIGKKSAATANRPGVAERLPEPAGPQRLAVALARLAPDERRRRALALAGVQTAKPHDATPRSRRRTVPGR